ncbi:hypothetical protein AAVH_40311 [Aphelenchoides avenae]|nr:hypothetical protein AAVH_40311 [Aphelenchus avenae]
MLSKLFSYAFVLAFLLAFVGSNFAEAKKSCSPDNVVVNGQHYCPPDAPFDEEEHLCCRKEESAEDYREPTGY